MEDEVLSLHKEMKGLLKHNHARRESVNCVSKINTFKDVLNLTMKFWPKNVMDLVDNDDDKRFLESMMTDRLLTIPPEDHAALEKIAKRVKR